MKTLPLGTVSHGTLRPQDLVASFCDALRQVRGNLPRKFLPLTGRRDDDPRWRHPDVWGDIEALEEALDYYCPPYCRFGTHEGDGSDFGCWPDLERVEEAIAEGDIARISDPSELDALYDPPRSEPDFALFANDHGNLTLYQRRGFQRSRWTVAWEIV